MSAFKDQLRNETAQTAPARIERRRRPRVPYRDFPADFVTQVIHGRPAADEPAYLRPPRNAAVEAYRSGARVTVRHMPTGYGHAGTA